MSFRQALYWCHLCAAVVAGVIILTMSATGVILTYEKQMIEMAEPIVSYTKPIQPLALDTIISDAKEAKSEAAPSTITLHNDPEKAIEVRYGRSGRLYFDPYSGENLGEGPEGLRSFLSTTMQFHRWFALQGEARNTGRFFTNIANLIFLFILVSGLYLWLPRVFKWQNFKKVLFFQKTKTTKARDFNWHHVMGIWSAIPLIIIVATGTVFYYKWANDLIYQLAGEAPPVRGRSSAIDTPATPIDGPLPIQSLLEQALNQLEINETSWRTISFNLPNDTSQTMAFNIYGGYGGEITKRSSLTLDRTSGGLESWQTFGDNTPGRQARLYVRFLHTGESLGLVGQTLAGIVSLAALFLIWTGIALAWRKYIRPLLNNRNNKTQQQSQP